MRTPWWLGRTIFAFAVGATVSACGGGGGGSSANHDSVALNGGIVTVTGIANQASNSATANPISVTVGGTTETVLIPAGVSVSVGQSLAIIPEGATLLSNVTVRPGIARAPGLTVYVGIGTGAQGNSGVILSSSGALSAPLGFPVGSYTMSATGSINIAGTPNSLTIGELSFVFESNGTVLSLPTVISGAAPANGSTNFDNAVTLTFDPAYASGTSNLRLDTNDGTLSKTASVSSTTDNCVFSALGGQIDEIPNGGINVLTFTH